MLNGATVVLNEDDGAHWETREGACVAVEAGRAIGGCVEEAALRRTNSDGVGSRKVVDIRNVNGELEHHPPLGRPGTALSVLLPSVTRH